MKTTLRLAALALSLAAPAAAQQGPRGGIGIALSNFDVGSLLTGGSLPAAQIYVPINVSPGIRIEPQLGILKLEDDVDPSQDMSVFTVGVGLLFMKHVGQQTIAYVGPRIALSRVSQPVNDPFGPGTLDATGTDFRLAGVVGGEYLFSPHFSIGAEAQLAYTSVGDRDAGSGVNIPGGSSFATSALVFFRTYLF